MRDRTPLEYALMCLVAAAPATGNQIVRLLRRYPLAGTGKSPGAVYPALHRLEDAGLMFRRARLTGSERSRRLQARLRREAAGGPSLTSSRRGTVEEFALTRIGVGRLRSWAVRPVARADVLERPEHLGLRLWVCAGLWGPAMARRLTVQLGRLCTELAEELEVEIAGAPGTLASPGLLAMEGSLEQMRARARWAGRAERQLRVLAGRRPWLDLPPPGRDAWTVVDEIPRRVGKHLRLAAGRFERLSRVPRGPGRNEGPSGFSRGCSGLAPP